MITGGYFLTARQSFESDIFKRKPAKWFKIWAYIIGKVNHKNTEKFKRGEGFFTYGLIMEMCNCKHSEVDHCLRWLKSATMIATRKATRGMTIQIINYNKYQNSNNYKSDTESDNKSDSKAIQKRHCINNNDNNDKKLKKEYKKNIYIVINYLNQITGQHFSLDDETTKRHLTARLKTHTVDDCKAVILNRAVKWIDDDKMKEYLRPATLFNATKFEQYLGQVSPEDTMEWRIKQERKEMQNG